MVRFIGADGGVRRLRVSGEGRNLDGGQSVTADDVIVFYANTQTVASLSGVRGFDTLAFRLGDTRPAAVSTTVAAVRRTLAAVPGFAGFSELPAVPAAGDWPGKSAFDQFSKFFYVITVLALLAALVLISNTITTLVAEQTSEIAIMEAIGGRRRQIASIYLKTALLRFLVWLVKKVANVEIPLTFPLWYLAPALAGITLLALLITLPPIQRAVHYQPRDA